MIKLEFIRNKKIEEYVFISQVVFLLLVGILLVRVYSQTTNTITSLYKNFILLIIPVSVVIIIKSLEKKGLFGNRVFTDLLINSLYLITTLWLLTDEQESFFKFLILMPVAVSALQYGTTRGYFWALMATGGLLVASWVQGAQKLDVDILVIGVIWLFAWLLGKMSDTEKNIRDALQQQASIDEMTGVYNHRSFYYYLEESFLKAKLAKKKLTLIMLDVDFFKYYNDAYGHKKGDEVLSKLAKVIESTIGNWGICARYGGDEFAVILRDCDGGVGVGIGEAIRKKVEGTEFEGANILPGGHLTISVGVASYPDNADTKESLVEKADEALYRAKYTNTNKVELYYSVFDEIGHSLQDQDRDLLNSMRTLMMVVNAKDRYTYGHSERVMHYATQIGAKMGMWEGEIQDLIAGAMLHDIGKIEVTREILNKPGKLTKEEWEAICQHSVWGADIIRPISALKGAIDIVLYHHENYDGTGYPYAKAGKDIPLGARILRVADSFDAMVSNRPYKRSLSVNKAIDELIKYRGIYYDPDVLEVFIEYINQTDVLAFNPSLN